MRLAARIGDDLAVGVGELGELPGDDFVPRRLVVIDLLPAEELDVGLRDRLAGDGVGHEVIGLAGQRLLDDRRVVDPDDDEAGVAAGHLGLDQIGAGLLQRRGDGHAACRNGSRRGSTRHLPLGHLPAEILLLVLLDQPVADVADVDLLPVEIAAGFDLRNAFTSSSSFSTLISWAVNSTCRPLRKRYSTVAPRPAGWVWAGSKRPQLPTIWSSRCCQLWRRLPDSALG